MARRPVLGGSSGLAPFGSAGASFSSFNVASAGQTAYLEFAKVQADYEAGVVGSDAYLAALEKYANSLKKTDSAYYSAQTRIAETRYTIGRDRIATDIDAGTATYADLVAYDQAALAAIPNPDSDVYRTRQSRLWSSEQQAFSEAEKEITSGLSKGTVNYTQALAYYQQQLALYSDNPPLVDAINDRIEQARAGMQHETDQKVVDDWGAGRLDLGAFIAYAQKAIADDPASARSRDWQTNLDTATKQAVSQSLSYRYGLTEEYKQLALLVTSTTPPKGSASQTSRTIMGSDGHWHTVYSTTYGAPSASEVAAYQEAVAKANQAKARMAEIVRMVSGLPGGWVTEDDMVATIAAQQATLAKGTPEWLQLQAQIDSYRSRKAADELLNTQGVRISLPGVGSETQISPYVGAQERPVVAGAGGATVPAVGAGGGGAAGRGGGTPLPAVRPTTGSTGPLRQVTGTSVATWTATGFPRNMDPDQFARFYSGFVDAIRSGSDSYTDPSTGISYYLPWDPNERVAMLTTLAQSNIELAQQQLADRVSTGKDSDAARAKVTAATQDYLRSLLYIADTESPGSTKGAPATLRAEQTEKVRGPDGAANPIAAGVALMRQTESTVAFLAGQAQQAWDDGDYTRALAYIRQATSLVRPESGTGVSDVLQRLASLSASAQGLVGGVAAEGVELPAAIRKDYEQLVDSDSWFKALWEKSGLDELAANFLPAKGPNGMTGPGYFAFDSAGSPVFVGGEVQLASDVKRTYQNGKIVPERTTYAGVRPDGTQDWSAGGKATVTVLLTLGDRPEPVEVPYTVTTVGSIGSGSAKGAASITAKTVDVVVAGRHYVMAENPFAPGQWLPLLDAAGRFHPLSFVLPAGVTVIAQPTALLGSTKPETPQFSFRGADGQQYLLGLDQATGTYALYQPQGDTVLKVSNLDKLNGGQAGLDILAGIGLGIDPSVMTADQRAVFGLGLNMAFIGDTADAKRWVQATMPKAAYVPPKATTYLVGGEGNEALGIRVNTRSIGPVQGPPLPASLERQNLLGPQATIADVLTGVSKTPVLTWNPAVEPLPGGISNPAVRDTDRILPVAPTPTIAPWTPPPVTQVLVGLPGNEAVQYKSPTAPPTPAPIVKPISKPPAPKPAPIGTGMPKKPL